MDKGKFFEKSEPIGTKRDDVGGRFVLRSEIYSLIKKYAEDNRFASFEIDFLKVSKVWDTVDDAADDMSKFGMVSGKFIYSESQKLQKTLEAYEKRPVDTVDVITGLIDLSKQIRDAKKRGEKLNLSEDELAFYDALETNDSEVKILGDEILRNIAREITEKIRESKTIDWPLRESGRAKIMASVKRVLNKNGYPIPKKDAVTQAIMKQAEMLFA